MLAVFNLECKLFLHGFRKFNQNMFFENELKHKFQQRFLNM